MVCSSFGSSSLSMHTDGALGGLSDLPGRLDLSLSRTCFVENANNPGKPTAASANWPFLCAGPENFVEDKQEVS